MTITFPVTPNLTPRIERAVTPITLVESIKDFTGITVEAAGTTHDHLIGNCNDPEGWNGPQRMNGFVRAVHAAFDAHLPLILSPDDVWITIAQGFSAHVNNNAEKLRSMFVSHQGQEYIEIQRDFFVKGSPDNDWMGGFAEFSDKIAEYIGKKRDLLVSKFTTTGPVQKAASEVVLMDAMKAYFTYGCRTCCGIPTITLEGTPEDWVQIRDRARALSEFDCQTWIDALVPVLDEFVKAANGQADTTFWQSFYKVGGGSGGPYMTGAINVLFPYIGVNATRPNSHLTTWQNRIGGMCGGPSTDMIPSGLAAVPFKWIYHDREFPMQFLGGFVGTSQDQETLAMRPALGWAVADRPEK